MTTMRDLNVALDTFVNDVQKNQWFEVLENHFDSLAGMWGEDLYELAKKDTRIGFELRSDPEDKIRDEHGNEIKDLYVYDAMKFEDLSKAWQIKPPATVEQRENWWVDAMQAKPCCEVTRKRMREAQWKWANGDVLCWDDLRDFYVGKD